MGECAREFVKKSSVNPLTLDGRYYILRCVTADYDVSDEFSKRLDEKYDMTNKLKTYYPVYEDSILGVGGNLGKALLVENVFNLVVKPRDAGELNYDYLDTALYNAAGIMRERGIDRIALVEPFVCGSEELLREKWVPAVTLIFGPFCEECLVCALDKKFTETEQTFDPEALKGV